jgi:ABC-type glycerol-3-phosphate transport system substrate-binding protein
MMKYSKKAKIVTACFLTLCILSGCQKGAAGTSTEQTGDTAARDQVLTPTEDFVYTVAYETLDLPPSTYSMGFYVEKDSLYYALLDMSDPDPTKRYHIYNKPLLTEAETTDTFLPLQEGESGRQFSVDSAGNIILLSSATQDSQETYYLSKFDKNGSRIYREEVPEDSLEQMDTQYVCTDEADRIYITAGDQLLLFEGKGSYYGNIKTPAPIQALGKGKNGIVYIQFRELDRNKLYAIDFNEKKLSANYPHFDSKSYGILSAGIVNDLLMNSGTDLYDYSISEGIGEPILNWTQCSMDGSAADYVAPLTDGRIAVLEIDQQDTKSAVSLTLLERRPASEVPGREVLVMASLCKDAELNTDVVEFNKKSDRYWIKMVNYAERPEDVTPSHRLALFQDLTTHDIDLVNLFSIKADSYVKQGVFEDLMPYLEKSKTLKAEDFVDGVLDTATYRDTLIALPNSFILSAFFAKKEIVGDQSHWTIEDLLALQERYPEARLYQFSSKTDILFQLIIYNSDEFIDWEQGTCHFETDTFIQYLELADQYKDGTSITREERNEMFLEDKLLFRATSIGDVDSYIQHLAEMQGLETTFVGYPTGDGSSGILMETNGGNYSIAANSRHKEGAWAFIEWLQEDYQGNSFPALQKDLDEAFEEAMSKKYTESNSGEQVLIPRWSFRLENGERYEHDVATQEEINVIKELIADASRPSSNYGSNGEIWAIIYDEAIAYFANDKTAEEVAANIQNRAQIFMAEEN